MRSFLVRFFLVLLCPSVVPLCAEVTIDKEGQSVTVVTDTNVVRIEPWSSGTIRVEAAPGKEIPEKISMAVIGTAKVDGWTAKDETSVVRLKGPRLQATLDKNTGLVSFFDAAGEPLLKQKEWSFQPAQKPQRDGLEVGATFERAAGERYFGGGVIDDNFRRPTTVIPLENDYLQMHIPILYSARGYGFFWDNASRGQLTMTADSLNWDSSAGDLADFYVMAGPGADAVISEYRNLTGRAPIYPKWAYGFWFSKNKFNSQKEVLNAANLFRQKQFPIDLLFQDYFFWKPSDAKDNAVDWGSDQFVTDRYPDPKAMLAELHDQDHIHLMAAVWPKFDPQTQHGQ